jgi:subtilisin family serine protease
VFVPPYDDTGTNDIHGTCCAGVAAAAGDNKKGGLGIAYRARILPVKIFAGREPRAQCTDRRRDPLRRTARGRDFVQLGHPGATRTSRPRSKTSFAPAGAARGAWCAARTGNEYESSIGFSRQPLEGVRRRRFQRPGQAVGIQQLWKGDLLRAPSSDDDRNRPGITTTDLSAANRGYALKSAYTADFGGTSSATPLAAGIAALVLSVKSSLTWKQVGSILKSTADKIDRAAGRYKRGFSRQYGFGRPQRPQSGHEGGKGQVRLPGIREGPEFGDLRPISIKYSRALAAIFHIEHGYLLDIPQHNPNPRQYGDQRIFGIRRDEYVTWYRSAAS